MTDRPRFQLCRHSPEEAYTHYHGAPWVRQLSGFLTGGWRATRICIPAAPSAALPGFQTPVAGSHSSSSRRRTMTQRFTSRDHCVLSSAINIATFTVQIFENGQACRRKISEPLYRGTGAKGSVRANAHLQRFDADRLAHLGLKPSDD
jgi:hypothetical protein